MIKKKLPKTDSISELAHFWDKHDVTDFEDLLEEVSEPVFSKGKDIQLYLELDEIQSLEKLARQRGLKNNELIRECEREGLGSHLHLSLCFIRTNEDVTNPFNG